MVACDRTDMPSGDHNYCVFAGRRDGKDFALSDEEIVEKYRNNLCMVERMPDALSGAMGNRASWPPSRPKKRSSASGRTPCAANNNQREPAALGK